MKLTFFFALALSLLTFPATFSGCRDGSGIGGTKAKAPFSDGLYFEYDVDNINAQGESTGPGREVWRIDEHGEDMFIITKKHYTKTADAREFMIMDREFIVNENGIVEECEFKSWKGKYTTLWIPVDSLEVGETVLGREKIFGKRYWNGWDTYRMSDKPEGSINFYYELDQGFFVGSDGSGLRQELTLIDSNAGIPLH